MGSDSDSYGTLAGSGSGSGLDVNQVIFVYEKGTVKNFENVDVSLFLNNGLIENVKEIEAHSSVDNNANGEIKIGEGTDIDTMAIHGQFNNDNGQIDVDMYSSKAPKAGRDHDQIAVDKNVGGNGGSATIDGGVVEVSMTTSLTDPSASSWFYGGVKNVFLSTTDGLTVNTEMTASEGTFDMPLFKPVLGHDANDYWIAYQRDYIYGPQGKTYNQTQFGNYIDDIGKAINLNEDLFPVLVALDGLSADKTKGIVSDRALHALDEMSGALYGTVSTIAVQHANMVNNTIADHLREYNPCQVRGNNWNAWGMAYGLGGASQYDQNAAGYKYSVAGSVIGLDRQITPDRRMGAYFSVGSTNTSMKGLAEKAESTDIFTGLYFHGADNGCWYTTLFAGFGYSDFEAERNIAFIGRKTESDFEGYQANFYGERGLQFLVRDRLCFQPYIALQYIGMERTDFQEYGADVLDLTVDAERTSSLRTMLGAKISGDFAFNGLNINGQARAAWVHEYLDTCSLVYAQMSNPGATRFESNAKYQVRGNETGSDWGLFGLGLSTDLTEHAKLFGNYDCMANGNQALHVGNLGLEFGW